MRVDKAVEKRLENKMQQRWPWKGTKMVKNLKSPAKSVKRSFLQIFTVMAKSRKGYGHIFQPEILSRFFLSFIEILFCGNFCWTICYLMRMQSEWSPLKNLFSRNILPRKKRKGTHRSKNGDKRKKKDRNRSKNGDER
jgi:hypothetical protein